MEKDIAAHILEQYSCLENPMVGYGLWGCKDSDMTEATWHGTAREDESMKSL